MWKLSKIAFDWGKVVKIAFDWGKFVKIGIFWVKFCKKNPNSGVKIYKNAFLRV